MHPLRKWLAILVFVLALSAILAAQTGVKKRTVVVNGMGGEVLVYEIDGRQYIDLAALAQIANGSLSYQGNQIVLNVPAASHEPPPQQASGPGSMSNNFMGAAVQALAAIKQWRLAMAYGITKGIPGDGSQIAILRDKAAEATRLAKVAVANDSDSSAMQLLNNQFNFVMKWYEKLVQGRKQMNTGNYSMSQDALANDSLYQKIASCSDFLNTMIPGGTYSDDGTCH